MDKKIIVVGPGRCGSNLLIQTLKQHPDIVVENEILHKLEGLKILRSRNDDFLNCDLSEQQYLTEDQLYKMSSPEYLDRIFKDTNVVKILYHQLTNHNSIIQQYILENNIDIIHLKRKNHLARYASQLIAEKAKRWILTPYLEKDWECPHITMDSTKLFNVAKRIDEQSEYFDGLFCNNNVIDMDYESFTNNLLGQFDILQEKMGITPVSLKPATRKSANKPLSILIDNFEELEEEFKGTNLEWCFEDSKYYFVADWFSHNIMSWEIYLAPFKDKPVNFLEIGAYQGRSAIWTLENILTHSRSMLTIIEPGYSDGGTETLKTNISVGGYDDKVVLIESESSILQGYEWPYDFIYVDGSHHPQNILEDAVNSFRLLKVGGLMCFDDYKWPIEECKKYNIQVCPQKVIDAFVLAYGDSLEVVYQDYQIWIKKIK